MTIIIHLNSNLKYFHFTFICRVIGDDSAFFNCFSSKYEFFTYVCALQLLWTRAHMPEDWEICHEIPLWQHMQINFCWHRSELFAAVDRKSNENSCPYMLYCDFIVLHSSKKSFKSFKGKLNLSNTLGYFSKMFFCNNPQINLNFPQDQIRMLSKQKSY